MNYKKPPQVALITAIDSEDGDLLAAYLLVKNYQVHGIKCCVPLSGSDPQAHAHVRQGVTLHAGNLSDTNAIMKIIKKTKPDEIYNLSGIVQADTATTSLLQTANVHTLGTLRLLQGIRESGLGKKTHFLNVSTSEMKEFSLQKTQPKGKASAYSPEFVNQLHAYLITAHYREAFGMYACNGVQFNPEGPCSGERLVTHQITQSLAKIAQGHDDSLMVESLDTLRDWTPPHFAAQMQWLMLQQSKPSDSLLTNGAPQTLREFIALTAAEQGIQLAFKGTGQDEYAVVVAANPDKAPAIDVGQVILGVLPKQAAAARDTHSHRGGHFSAQAD
jgi:GDPmannose 4,6-dehydratase